MAKEKKLTAKQLANMVDDFHSARQERLRLKRLMEDKQKEETNLKESLILHMRAQGVSVIGGAILTVTLKSKIVPKAEDWGVLYDYIREHDAFDLLHRRLTETAVKARWDDGINIPGVVEFEYPELSLSTVRG